MEECVNVCVCGEIWLMCSHVTFIFLFTCESWTLTAELKRIPQDTTHLIQRPCHQRGSTCKDPAGNWTTRRPPDHRKETESAVVWSCLPFMRSGKKPSCKAQWKREEDKADRGRGGKTTCGNGLAWSSASPRGQWRTEENGETGCKIICGAPTTLVFKGLMVMMMMTTDLLAIKEDEFIYYS